MSGNLILTDGSLPRLRLAAAQELVLKDDLLRADLLKMAADGSAFFEDLCWRLEQWLEACGRGDSRFFNEDGFARFSRADFGELERAFVSDLPERAMLKWWKLSRPHGDVLKFSGNASFSHLDAGHGRLWVDFEGANLAGAALSGMWTGVFHDCYMPRLDANGASFRHCEFINCVLDGADFRGAVWGK